MAKVGNKVGAKVQVLPRLNTLYYFVYELAQAFHASSKELDCIDSGVYDNQFIKIIRLSYLNQDNEVCAYVDISIDWDKHLILAKTEGRDYITIDTSKSIVDNIVQWRKVATTHIDCLMDQYNITRVCASYYYRDEYSTPDKCAEVMKILGHVDNKSRDKIAFNESFQSALKNQLKGVLHGEECILEFDTRELEEVSVRSTWYV